MEEGLAQQIVYGSGEGQNTKHFYAGTINVPKKTKKKKCNKKSKK